MPALKTDGRRARGRWVLALSIVVVTAAFLPLQAAAGPQAQAGERRVWIEGYDSSAGQRLTGLDQVTVNWSGFAPNSPVTIYQCAHQAHYANACEIDRPAYGLSDANGSGQASFVVRDIGSVALRNQCLTDEVCLIAVSQCALDFTRSATVPIRVDPYPDGYGDIDVGDGPEDDYRQPIDPPPHATTTTTTTTTIPIEDPQLPPTSRPSVDVVGSTSALLGVRSWMTGAASDEIGVRVDYSALSGPLATDELAGAGTGVVIPDLAITSAPMPEEQVAALAADGVSVVNVPIGISSLVLAHRNTWLGAGGYNTDLINFAFSPETAARAYPQTGQLLEMTSAVVVADNGGCDFPNTTNGPMKLWGVYRLGASGANLTFTSWLHENVPDIRTAPPSAEFDGANGQTSARRSPVEMAHLINRGEGTAGELSSQPWNFVFGYIDLSVARATALNIARVKNPAGNYVLPLDANVLAGMPEWVVAADGTVDLDYSPSAPNAYPMPIVYYAVVRSDVAEDKVDEVRDLLTWIAGDEGQAAAQQVGFVPMPEVLQLVAASQIAKVGTSTTPPTTTPTTPPTTGTRPSFAGPGSRGGGSGGFGGGSFGGDGDSGDIQVAGESEDGEGGAPGGEDEAGDPELMSINGDDLDDPSFVPAVGLLLAIAAACLFSGPVLARVRRRRRSGK